MQKGKMQPLGKLLEERRRRHETSRCESSLAEFFKAAWHEVLERDRELTWSFHYQYLCELLESISNGEFKRQHPDKLGVIINVPPRTSKSGLITVSWPAWAWIENPALRFLCASYSGTLSADHSIKRRNLITSLWYQSRWASRFTLSADLNRTDDYANDQTGRITATSVGGTVTGLGGDICIGDDLLNQDDQYSEAARKATNRWIDATWATKLNNPNSGVFVYVSQRLHEDDLAGHLLEQQPDAWLLVRIPLEAEEDETYILPLSGYELKRSAGEVLQPERFTQNVVRALKDSSNWGGQYQQRPSPEQGGIIKKPWWRFYVRPGQPKPEGCLVLPDSFDEMAQSWDMSFKDKKTSDFVCGGVWGRVGAMKYLMPDIVWDRLDFVGTKKAVIALSVRWPFTYSKWIEDKANGSAIIAELQTEISGLIAVEPMGSKEARLHAAAPDVEAGNVILPHPSIALAIAQVCVRDFEPAIISIRKAAEVDPLGPLFQAHVAWILNCAGKSEEAWNQLQSSLELHPSDYYANRILMYVAQTPERCRRAIEKVQRIAGLTRSGRHASAGVLGVLHARLGAREKALEIAAQLEQVVSSEHAAAYILALIHCLLGNLEVAVDWLERAEQTGAGLLIILGCEPTLGPLRPLERFQVLLKRLGLS